MRILLAQNARYYPSHGGGDKSNRLLLEALAELGHECRVISRLTPPGSGTLENYVNELTERSVTPIVSGPDAVVFEHSGVEVHAITGADPRGYFAARVSAF